MNKIYDIAIVGAGVAGAFAANILAEREDLKTCLIDFGRPPNKRRKQLEGWLGCFPNSNARIYKDDDYSKIQQIAGTRITNIANTTAEYILKETGPTKLTKNKEPNNPILNKLDKYGYSFQLNNFIQWKPENIHILSRYISENIIDRENFDLLFDTELYGITKENDLFSISTEHGIIQSKKILLCIGRSGWRVTHEILKNFNLIQDDNYAYFGFRTEISSTYMRDWNESHCSIFKNNLFVGPLSWKGTVIPEDHEDVVITSWRSNEDRWATDKTAFSVIMRSEYKNKGTYQTERLAKLAYILSDNRVGKTKIKEFLTSKNDIHLIPEYKWLASGIKELEKIIPGITEKGHLYLPDILTYTQQVNLNKHFETDVEGLFVAGESSGVSGLYSAMLSGIIATTYISK